jgi:16S rRNA (cytidine1402-2'-O)-methyltransferase
VILVGGAAGVTVDAADWRAALEEALVAQPLRAAVDEITARYGLKRKEVYDAALALKAQE